MSAMCMHPHDIAGYFCARPKPCPVHDRSGSRAEYRVWCMSHESYDCVLPDSQSTEWGSE